MYGSFGDSERGRIVDLREEELSFRQIVARLNRPLSSVANCYQVWFSRKSSTTSQTSRPSPISNSTSGASSKTVNCERPFLDYMLDCRQSVCRRRKIGNNQDHQQP
ncbi:hypothetical protein Zmor_005553 [Zophobas morio]|uniref:Uncharacterized protein n=1 Tax=Zophobas morio TaxID=2755281 RepID=A0AA38IT34_9CUCU|nr:hypothetical protein Zmor_005553 [Zophobas morio]